MLKFAVSPILPPQRQGISTGFASICLLLFFGSDAALAISSRNLLTTNGANQGDDHGYSVARAGDVNGDGLSDIIVGAPGYSSGTGQAHVYFGGPFADNQPDLTLTGQQSGDRFGSSVAGAGDVNGDGYADLVVGSWSKGMILSASDRDQVVHPLLRPPA